MKQRKLIILAVAPMMCLAANAQKQEVGPKKGDLTVAATVSYNSYTSLNAPAGNLTDYNLQAVSTNWNDKKLMVGIEGGWFFKDLWKLTLGGGLSITSNPGYAPVPGTIDENYEKGDGSIPNYGAVANQSDIRFNVFTGVDRYFKTKVCGLMPYVGVRVGYAYGQNTALADDETWMGKSVGESFNIRGAATVGVDYFLTEGFFVGAQVDPFAYTYNKSTYKPQEGLGNLSANSNNFSVLAAPTIKVGFKF
jgi:outer membrane protein W